MSAKKWMSRKYGIDITTIALVSDEKLELTDKKVNEWREQHGCPHPNSPLCRGYFIDLLSKERV